jgi:magnesium chelatase accessory protein
LEFQPRLVAGHSAGAALMLQWALLSAPRSGGCSARALLAVNGALQPLQGLPGLVFPVMARLLRHSRWLPGLVARHAREPSAVRRLIAGTGSQLDDAGVAQYQALLMQTSHVNGALDMMAGWRLDELLAALPALQPPLWLVTGMADRTVAPQQSRDLARRLPVAVLHELPGLGHLAHEEAPQRVADLIDALWRQREAVTAANTAAESACGNAT